MRSFQLYPIVMFAILMCCQAVYTQAGILKPPRPLPLLEDDREPLSIGDIEKLLSTLRDERNALDAEWRDLSKRGKLGKGEITDDAVKKLAEDISRKLKQGLFPNPISPPLDEDPPAINQEKTPKKSNTVESNPKPEEKQPSIVGDPQNLGQTLFRAGIYADALRALERVDVVGMKPEERAPILFFKACCQAQLGQTAKAIALLEDVVKVRGDERLVDYARWQMEELHWHRNVESVLQDIRNRLKAAEKAK